MAKGMLDTAEYEVRTGGLWRTIRSIIAGDLKTSNWVVLDKRNGVTFRLTDEEQELLNRVGEHLASLWLAPDFRRPKKDRQRQGAVVLENVVDGRRGSRRRRVVATTL